MERKLCRTVGAVLLTLVLSGSGLAAVLGSPHDLTPAGPAGSTEEVDPLCRACHVPHTGAAATYLPALNGSGSGTLCAGCHDGTVAGWVGGMDHPVEIAYPTRDDLRRPGTPLKLQKGRDGSDILTCATCHDPHAGGGITGMLRLSNAGSALCLGCHVK